MVHAVIEARRAAPAILYLPHLTMWWETAPASLRATLWMLLADLPADLPLLLFATADAPLSELHESASVLFGRAGLSAAVELDRPTAVERLAMFDGLISRVFHPAKQKVAKVVKALPPEVVLHTLAFQQRISDLAENQVPVYSSCRINGSSACSFTPAFSWVPWLESEEFDCWQTFEVCAAFEGGSHQIFQLHRAHQAINPKNILYVQLPVAPEGFVMQAEADRARIEAEARRLWEEDESALRSLRMALREIATKLLCTRQWKDFWEPVDPEEEPEYYTQVS